MKIKKHLTFKNSLLFIPLLLVVLLIGWLIVFKANYGKSVSYKEDVRAIATSTKKSSSKPSPTPKTTPTPSPTATPASQPKWPVLLTRAQAASITVVVNKKHRLPSDYVPNLVAIDGGRMRSEAASAITRLFSDALNQGIGLKIVSDYRSYDEQAAVYNGYVARDGQAQADTYSARPGFSEHQTGLAADIGSTSGGCSLQICFGNTNEGKWLAAHAAEYGYIIRYPAGKEATTGYQYEPWHLRYVGSIAQSVANSGKTLDEYFGVPAGGYQ